MMHGGAEEKQRENRFKFRNSFHVFIVFTKFILTENYHNFSNNFVM